jgi:hypothetical protein
MTNTLHVAPMHDLVDLAGCWCTLPRRQGAGGHPDAGRPAQGCRAGQWAVVSAGRVMWSVVVVVIASVSVGR